MRRSRPASPSPVRRYTGPSDVLLKAIWKPRLARNRVRARRASSPARRRRCWWRPPAQSHPRAAHAGPWSCWPARWSSSLSMRTCRARRCVGASLRTISSRGARTCGASRKLTAPTLPTWRTCLISTPKHPIQSGPWSALTRAQPNWSVRCANRSQPGRGNSNAMTANISATAQPICSSSSISIAAGAGSRSPSTAGPRLRPMYPRTRRRALSRGRPSARRAR